MTQQIDDLVVEFTSDYYQNEKKYELFYHEKGLVNGFTVVDGKKVKEIIGYSDYISESNDDDDFEVIGYIYSKSGKDIELEYDEEELWDAFFDSLRN